MPTKFYAQRLQFWLLCLLAPLLFLAINEYYLQILAPDYLTYDIRRIIEALMLFVVVSNLLINKKLRHECLMTIIMLPKCARWLLATFFIIGLISAVHAALPKYALLQVVWYSLEFCSALLVASLYHYYPKFNIILLTIIISSVAGYGLFAVISYGHIIIPDHCNSQIKIYPALAWPGFINPRFLMQFLSCVLPLMVIPILLYKPLFGPWIGFVYALTAYLWCLDFANQSRSVPLQILAVTIVLLLTFGRQAFAFLKQQGYALLGGLVLYLLLFHLFFNAPMRNLFNYDDLQRPLLWELASKMVGNHPLFGVGPMHFPYYAYVDENIAAHPHNALLMLAAEWGILATTALFSVALWGVWRWLSAIPKATANHLSINTYSIALTAALIAAASNSMIDGVIVTPLSQIMLAIIIGWMLGIYWRTQNRTVISIKRSHHWLLMLWLLISIGLCIHGLWPDMAKLHQYTTDYIRQCHHKCLLNPNFWAQGWMQLYH